MPMGGSKSKTTASEMQAQRSEAFSKEQQQHYDQYFFPIEESLLDPRDYDTGKQIRSNLLDFEQAKPEYQEAGQEQQSRFLGSMGLPTRSEDRTSRQNSVLNNRKMLDATMEAAIRQGIRSGTASDVSMRRQNMLNLGKGYQGNMMQNLNMNAALAQQQDQFAQQKEQGMGAMIGAGLGLASGFSGFYNQRPDMGGGVPGGTAGGVGGMGGSNAGIFGAVGG